MCSPPARRAGPVGIEPGRGIALSDDLDPRPAPPTGRACLHASSSPRAMPAGSADACVVLVHGSGLAFLSSDTGWWGPRWGWYGAPCPSPTTSLAGSGVGVAFRRRGRMLVGKPTDHPPSYIGWPRRPELVEVRGFELLTCSVRDL
jgi:hypothetical protein